MKEKLLLSENEHTTSVQRRKVSGEISHMHGQTYGFEILAVRLGNVACNL